MAHMVFDAIETMVMHNVPSMFGGSLRSGFRYLFSPKQITIVVDEHEDRVLSAVTRNKIFDAVMVYLPTKISPDTRRFKVNKTLRQRNLKIGVEPGVQVVDRFENNVVLKWKLTEIESNQRMGTGIKRFFELSFNKKYMDRVLDREDGYLEFVMKKSIEIVNNIEKVVKIQGDSNSDTHRGNIDRTGPVALNHPMTFDKLAMDPELKKAIVDDLDGFLRGEEFYRRVGKAWKRGYLLYGPPGTGKSSLIAAMANHLKYDIYDLDLTSLQSNKDLRRLMVSTSSRTIIVIEDIDCNVEMQVRQTGTERPHRKLTISGLLNFIDGLWSSCGDERVIVLTTNHKSKLDRKLLRPGRIDTVIHMSYCTGQGFRHLASNYCKVDDDHRLLGEIEDLIANVKVTPAEVAEKLMRSEDADIALTRVVNFLKRKMEANENKEDKANGPEVREPKMLKIEEDKANGPEGLSDSELSDSEEE